MDEFRTEIRPKPAAHKLSIHDSALTIGSCFADSIGQKLEKTKFLVSTNPFGTIYNPVSIHKLLLQSVFNQPPLEHTYLSNNGVVSNYDFHSSLSALIKSHLEVTIKEVTGHTHLFLKDAKFLIITYGTAWVYERIETGEVVANCHKVPSHAFRKSLLSQKRILESFEEMYHAVKAFNPAIRFILTVSPVRHLKDTLELNSVSKSILRLTCHTITELLPDVSYFPAYEMLMDDLRDYRFYAADLIHPSEQAVTYIWNKFALTYFDSETRIFLDEWQEIEKALTHKPFHPASGAHQNFLRETLKKLQELKVKVNVDEEIRVIESQRIPNADT